MALGTLRDQVIYPDTIQDQRRKNVSDDVLKEHLEQVNDALRDAFIIVNVYLMCCHVSTNQLLLIMSCSVIWDDIFAN